MRTPKAMLLLVAAAYVSLSVGCAGKPTTADLMRKHSPEGKASVQLKNRLAKDWEKGTKLVASGEKRVKKSEKRLKAAEKELKKAQSQVDKGKKEIAEGQKLIQESEKTFRKNFPDVDLEAAK